MTPKTGQTDFFSTDIPDLEPAPQTTQAVVKKEAPVLTPVEQEIYDSFSPEEKSGLKTAMSQIDFHDPALRTEYGRKVREGIAGISSKALKVARTRDLGEAGNSMKTLIKQLQGIDVEVKSRGIFGRVRSYIEEFNIQLSSVERNVERAVTIMQGHQAQLVEDNEMYEQLYKNNLAHYRALTRYIIAGKLKLDEERRTTLAQLKQKAEATGDMADIEAYDDYKSKLDKFDKFLSEFEATRLQCLQTAPTLRLAKGNNEDLIEKFDFIFLTAVPSWQNQIQIALALENSKQAGEAIDAAIDFTNDIIRKNAEKLAQGSIAIAQTTEREIIETETLAYSNEQLLNSIREVFRIKAEGQQKREQSRFDRAAMEEEMKNELLRLASG